MKKLIVLAAIGISLVSSASMLDWKYTGVAADKGSSVYLYVGATAPSATDFADLAALQADTHVLNTGKTVAEVANPRNPSIKNYTTNGTAERDWVGGDTFYYILVNGDTIYVDPTTVTVAAGKIYEKGNTGPGSLDTNTSASTHTYGAFAPEPTSGILMLVGLGALALRRRKA